MIIIILTIQGSLSCELRTDDMEHLGSDEFNERVHVVVCLLDNDKTMEQKSQIFAKVSHLNSSTRDPELNSFLSFLKRCLT